MKKSKILMIIGSLLLLTLFVLPLWNITLDAPQYPDSLGIDIYITKMQGAHEGDIQNINIMNHYVGMEKLPEKMKEFELFPIVVIVMALLGVIIGFIGKRKLFLAWFVAMAILGSIGMYDFYLWEYKYGHNLDPKAAIQFPGQAYQPPLIGSKTILNFKAHSYPMSGGYMLFAGMFLSLGAFFVAGKEEEKEN
ncbi:MAG: hypothetical protein D8M58_11685 [Calditrichaeota bacterium]|nr:MAG: hypothetical protein DWQ03_12470 [Calditrichota bacterium]MBL1206056.1 hypothetical protein [Calditrichota bacterium]NOG45883.1 hypothetical protein [Calditrichota bacterium]